MFALFKTEEKYTKYSLIFVTSYLIYLNYLMLMLIVQQPSSSALLLDISHQIFLLKNSIRFQGILL